MTRHYNGTTITHLLTPCLVLAMHRVREHTLENNKCVRDLCFSLGLKRGAVSERP